MAREATTQYFSKEKLAQIDELRKILEKDYNDCPKDEKYKESSELASKILESADCILTYSRADDDKKDKIPIGSESNRFLNVTFNKLATDEHLKIETIYHCKPKEDQYCLRYEILEIGIPNTQYTQIEWFEWDAEIDSIIVRGGIPLSKEAFLRKLQKNHIKLTPNVNQPLNDTHVNIISTSASDLYEVQFGVILKKKNI